MDTLPQPQHPTELHRAFEIFVNTRPKTVERRELTFEQVVALAFDPVPSGPGITLTVSYRHADQHPAQGTLVAGQSVKIKNGTAFNAYSTDKS